MEKEVFIPDNVVFCRPASDLKSFTEIGLPAEYDQYFLSDDTTMEELITLWRILCYKMNSCNDFYKVTDHACAKAEALETLCRHHYIRADFLPIYQRLLNGLRSKSMTWFHHEHYDDAFIKFIKENYEVLSPGAYFRTDVIENALREALPGMQYDWMVRYDWPKAYVFAKRMVERESDNDDDIPTPFLLALFERAFKNIEKLTVDFFYDVLKKAVVS